MEAIDNEEETFDQKVGLRKRNVKGFLLPEVRRAIKDKNLTFWQK